MLDDVSEHPPRITQFSISAPLLLGCLLFAIVAVVSNIASERARRS